MTAGGPPWQIFGAQTREQQAADVATAGAGTTAAETAGAATPGATSAVVVGRGATAMDGGTTDVTVAAGPGESTSAGAATAAGVTAGAPAEAEMTTPAAAAAAADPPAPRSATGLPQRIRLAGRDAAGQQPGVPEPMQRDSSVSSPGEETRPGVSARLSALTRLVQIGSSRRDAGLSGELLQDAQQLLDRAGERLRLSDEHSVVALAGGTGSGKSSLFNKLAGANLSAVGVTRPVTRHAHACVWGAQGSGPLLEWLGVPRRFRFRRDSALEDSTADRGEAALDGLVLVDLPDHDSVASGASGQVEKLVGMTDLMVWVLDPQKYADAAVHQRYLVPLAGHSAVIAVVLNKSDLLTEAEAEECAADLRRLLDSEGLQNAPLLVTSAETGAGLDQLRTMLGNAVSQRRATTTRISADLDGITEEFLPYAREPEGTQPADRQHYFGVPPGEAQDVEDAFARAAGVSAVVDALETARGLRAIDYIGWPVVWLAERLTGRNPMRKIRLGRLWDELKDITAGASGAQQAEIDSALTKLADTVGQPLPRPWSQTTRSAVRSRSGQIPGALGAAMRSTLPAEDTVLTWWRAIGVLQGLLLGCVIVGLAWIGALLAFGVFHADSNVPRLFSNSKLLPWVIILVAVLLLAGWLISWACGSLVRKAAEDERKRTEESIRDAIAVVAREMVFLPTEAELAEYRRFRDELRIAAGT